MEAELNLIPHSMKNKYIQKNIRMNILFVAIIIVAVLFFALYIPYLTLQQLKSKEFNLKSQVDAQQYVVEERNMMMDQMNQTNELITLVDSFDKDRQLIYQYIIDLQKMIPADISCTSFSYTTDAITILGISENYKSPAIFAANLQEAENYKNANLISVSDSDTRYVFNINISLKD